MNTRTLALLLSGGFVVALGALPLSAQTEENQNPAAPPKESAAKPDIARAKQILRVMSLSPGLAEIVKLKEAGLDDGVIVQFIQNSPIAYNPSAQEIIELRENNFSASVISAILQRGGELRQRSGENAQTGPSPAVSSAPTAPAGSPVTVNVHNSPAAAPTPTVTQTAAPVATTPTVFYGPPATYAVASPVVYSGYPAYYGGYGNRCSPYTIYTGGYYGYGNYGYGNCGPALSVGFRFGGGYGYYGGYRGGYHGGYYGGYRGCR